mmetsp:Transcript_16120/g.43966  ORF Transcript_16120/g.43966 Transcript_16120/m.43966 type:complete len:203 (+) Transcript_16120:2062-2670(+)
MHTVRTMRPTMLLPPLLPQVAILATHTTPINPTSMRKEEPQPLLPHPLLLCLKVQRAMMTMACPDPRHLFPPPKLPLFRLRTRTAAPHQLQHHRSRLCHPRKLLSSRHCQVLTGKKMTWTSAMIWTSAMSSHPQAPKHTRCRATQQQTCTHTHKRTRSSKVEVQQGCSRGQVRLPSSLQAVEWRLLGRQGSPGLGRQRACPK